MILLSKTMNTCAFQFRRRGVALIWAIITMVAVMGFCSLAVDYGRAQLAKTELQRACDAAARYGASGLTSGLPDVVTAAQDRAIAAAADNKADGQSVVLDRAGDIEFGTWDTGSRTFTPLSGTARASANAIRVTAQRTSARGNPIPLTFAPLIGFRTCDVHAGAIATISSSVTFGLVGLDGISFSGQAYADSYDSSVAPYSVATARAKAVLATNAAMNVTGQANIRGDVHPGVGQSLNLGGNATISGSTSSLTTRLQYPPASSPVSTPGTDFVLGKNGSRTFAAGTYYFTRFSTDDASTVTFSGPVTIYVNGPVYLGGSYTVYQNRPGNLDIRCISSSAVNITSSSICAAIYAPLSDIIFSNKCDVYGNLLGKTVSINNKTAFHLDESLNLDPIDSASAISLVQ